MSKKYREYRPNVFSLSDNEFEAVLRHRLETEITATELYKDGKLSGILSGLSWGVAIGFILTTLLFIFKG